jgi:hypothetical protein
VLSWRSLLICAAMMLYPWSMIVPPVRFGAALGLALVTAAGVASCGGGSGTTQGVGGAHSGSSSGSGDSSSVATGGGAGGDSFVTSSGVGGMQQGFDIQPVSVQTITVVAGQSTPTVGYTATLDGAAVNAGWTLDRGDLGTIPAGPSSAAAFTPSGTTGGLVTVQGGFNGKTLKRQIMLKLTATQNGSNPAIPSEAVQIATTASSLAAGGGIGGVGGEGLGPGVTDMPTLTALTAPTDDGKSQGLTLLYPYDKTVWPRGMLAPLLMWSWAQGDADAVQIELATTSGSFSWTGTFARPAILAQTGGKFVRHPIPQDIWDMATNSAGGVTANGQPDQLTVRLTVAKGGMAYGPITETWNVAPGRLAGTVYYNSYGTHLVQNSFEKSFNNGPQFGAAVLSIAGGATAPSVVAGTASPLGSNTGCRVCHMVASDGSRLVVQHGESYPRTSTYDLKNGNAETSLNAYDSLFGWAGLSPDGKLALTNAADLAASAPASQLYTFPPVSNVPLAVTGIPANLQAGTPAFSPDGKHVAFDFLGGAINGMSGNGTQLVALDFDPMQMAFTNLLVLATMPAGDSNKRAGFPSFFPTNDGVVYHYQTVASNHRYNTWHKAQAQIWWSDLKTGTAVSLDALNGFDPGGATSYLPTAPNNHASDTSLNYEPTVNPVVSGGYAWVVFTSRRLYGNVATTDPWQSDPRDYDATTVANATTKKLWVAAVDIGSIQNGMFMQGVPPGSDPSHPAFYVPAQELLAGNARGFWVLDPCKPDGQSCATGDQCCNGYCEPNGPNGALVCSNTPPGTNCSMPQEKCTTAADCCDPTNLCVNGFCATKGIN